MADRLPIDANVLGYWGFDESLETDIAFDESTNINVLTVPSSPAVALGRIGNARQFNGTTTYAEPSGSSAQFRLQGDATFIVWAKIDSYNSSGSFLRTLLSCGTAGGNMLYELAVDSTGRLVYKHTAAGGTVIVRTAPASIRTAQIYSIAVRRIDVGGGNQNIEFYVDNVLKTVVDVTVNAVSSSLPVPGPAANSSAILSIGKTPKESDSAFWQGLLDEVSIHDMARTFQPYLRQAYYRISLSNDVNRLTYFNTIVSVSSYEMGGGVRWWCYESDKDLYVVKESPFGFFGPETRLTTPGGGAATKAGNPELIYDPATDTLLVFFVAGNRIYKLTAQSTDDPATINMPFTADTGSIIKALDNADGGTFANGGGARPPLPEDITYVNRTPVKLLGEDLTTYSLGNGGSQGSGIFPFAGPSTPTINFSTRTIEGFGLATGPRNSTQSGYRIFRFVDGANQLLGNATYHADANDYFFPFTPTYGDVFYAEAIDRLSRPSGVFSDAVVFLNGEFSLVGTVYKVGREGNGTEVWSSGNGGGQQSNFDLIVYVNRTPIKLSGEDAPSFDLGGGGGQAGQINASGSNRPGSVAIEVRI